MNLETNEVKPVKRDDSEENPGIAVTPDRFDDIIMYRYRPEALISIDNNAAISYIFEEVRIPRNKN